MELSFFFLGLHPWHMEVPRLGVKLELHLLAVSVDISEIVCDLFFIFWSF